MREACPLGLAPTTSSVLQLALGDALAIALVEHKGFTAADFGVLHPGGRLGAQVQRLRALAHDGDQRVVHDLDEGLARRQAAAHLLAERALPHPLDEARHDRQSDVRLEQRRAHLLQRVGDVLLAQAAATAQAVDGAGKTGTQAFEHGIRFPGSGTLGACGSGEFTTGA